MKFTRAEVEKMAKKLNVNLDNVSVDTLMVGVKIELEHGTENKLTNITNDNLEKTMKIALAHICEFPDYYDRLVKFEIKAEKYWKGKKKPSVFN